MENPKEVPRGRRDRACPHGHSRKEKIFRAEHTHVEDEGDRSGRRGVCPADGRAVGHGAALRKSHVAARESLLSRAFRGAIKPCNLKVAPMLSGINIHRLSDFYADGMSLS